MPSSENYVRNYKQEAAAEDGKRKRFREMRIRARRLLIKERGSLPKGYDVDHTTPLSKGGSNKRSNLKLQKSSANRSYRRRADGSMASKYD